MDSKYVPRAISRILILLVLMVFSAFDFGVADLNKDRKKCAEQLEGLADCLPYVGGDAKSPTVDCCSGLKVVLQNSKECLCILVKDRNDPDLGLKINATLALSLPEKCRAPTNVYDCPALLHLAPNSTDAKVFDDFAKSRKGSNSSAPAEAQGSSSPGKGSSATIKSSDGEKRIRGMRIEMVLGLLIIVVIHVLPKF